MTIAGALFGGLLATLVMGAMGMDDDMAEVIQMLHDNCGEESGADLSLVDKVNSGTDLSTVGDPKFKCYIKCIMESAGMMSEGIVDVDAVLSVLPEETVSKIENNLRACGTKTGSDDCDTAWQTQACWQKTNKDHYFLI